MKGMHIKSEIAHRERGISGVEITPLADPLHFDSHTTRINKAGSKCRVRHV